MSKLVDIAWPWRVQDREICYDPEGSANGEQVTLLEVSGEFDKPKIEVVKKTISEFSSGSGVTSQCLRLVLVTRSWLLSDMSHEKFARYNISQGGFTKVLDMQGLTTFFQQTRADGVGLFTSSSSRWSQAGEDDGMHFALIYDAFLGLWARYNSTTGGWQGVFLVPETSLDLEATAKRLAKLAHTEKFLLHLAADYTVDFLGVKSGELPQRVVEIERHSGHHAQVLRPASATYKELENLSANATATANLISFYNGVISHLAGQLLQYLEQVYVEDSSGAEDPGLHVAYLKQRVKSISTYLRYLEQRTERQMAVTFHLVNQVNASTNLTVAHDTKRLAIASKRDASSMKILAAMATIFLPGAFIASLFSTNMFDWSANNGTAVISRRFWIYWTLTIPITIVTVGLWIGWEFWERKKQKREHRSLDILDE